MMFLDSWQLLAIGVAFLIVRILYRLTLHPLAKFPGPKLAAITSMYGASFDLPVTSSYCKEFIKLHEKYGPIVRIEPNHLHIQDLKAYNQIFKTGTKFAKDPTFYDMPFTDGSFYNISEPKDALVHKDIYQSAFSAGAVQKLEIRLKEHLDKFLRKLEAASVSSKVVDLSLGFRCLAADMIMEYCYDTPFGALDAPDFKCPLIVDLEHFIDILPASWYFPRLFSLTFWALYYLPRSVTRFVRPLASTFKLQDECEQQLRNLAKSPQSPTNPTIFHALLHQKSAGDRYMPRMAGLRADALLFYAAGTDVPAHALVVGTWHLLNDLPALAKLRKELRDAGLSRRTMNLSWSSLERLPYLRAVVKESLRLSHGIPGKLPRVVPQSGVSFCGQEIPPGTIISSSHYVYHMSEDCFKDAFQFKPERWLELEKSAQLDNFLLSFSRGSRACLGINLAYAELYNTFAYVLGSFEFNLAGTTARDMEWHDAFGPATFGHLKVRVAANED